MTATSLAAASCDLVNSEALIGSCASPVLGCPSLGPATFTKRKEILTWLLIGTIFKGKAATPMNR